MHAAIRSWSRSSEGLADRVGRLLADPELARRMGERAREEVGDFDIDAMVRRQESLYQQLLGVAG